jgi:hypothetical protein
LWLLLNSSSSSIIIIAGVTFMMLLQRYLSSTAITILVLRYLCIVVLDTSTCSKLLRQSRVLLCSRRVARAQSRHLSVVPISKYPVVHSWEDWTLFVSSDLVRSGPVLLYAAQKGIALTPRMEGMLGKVRRRALALAGCFYRASRLSQGTEGGSHEWDAMGRLPIEVIERIATLGKISIVAGDLVE